MKPHYYIMKNKKILRLESQTTFRSLPQWVQTNLFDESACLNQTQANWRVAIFRDEIMEFEEYVEWLASPECLEIEMAVN